MKRLHLSPQTETLVFLSGFQSSYLILPRSSHDPETIFKEHPKVLISAVRIEVSTGDERGSHAESVT